MRLSDTTEIERRSSNINALLWERRDFRYATSISFRSKEGEQRTISCKAPGFGQGIRCTDLSGRAVLHLEPGCLGGWATVGSRVVRVDPWRQGGYLVGFLLSADDSPLAAVDVDHQWQKPLWTQGSWDDAERLDLQTVAYFLDHVVVLDLENAGAVGWGGEAPVCGALVAQLRYPR